MIRVFNIKFLVPNQNKTNNETSLAKAGCNTPNGPSGNSTDSKDEKEDKKKDKPDSKLGIDNKKQPSAELKSGLEE